MQATGIKTMCILCGEPSGDRYAGMLAGEIHRIVPDISIFGVGGEVLAGENVRLITHIRSLSFSGFTQVLLKLPAILKIRKNIFQNIVRHKPDVIVMIDFPDFHISLAKKLKTFYAGLNQPAPVMIYYIPPQIWIWRKNRIRSIKRFFDAVIPVFSFETEVYTKHQIPVFFAGHPIIDALHHQCQEKTEALPGIKIALLPGSRKQEVISILPLLLNSIHDYVRKFKPAHSDLSVLIPVLSHIGKSIYRKIIEESTLKHCHPEVDICLTESVYETILASEVVLCKPGTNNLEIAFFGKPFIVVYRTNFLNFLIISLFVKISYSSLVNIHSGREIVSEFIQTKAKPDAIAVEIDRLISDKEYRNKMKCALDEVSGKIGLKKSFEVSRKNAEFIISFVSSKLPSDRLMT